MLGMIKRHVLWQDYLVCEAKPSTEVVRVYERGVRGGWPDEYTPGEVLSRSLGPACELV